MTQAATATIEKAVPTAPAGLITQAEYARRRGCSREAVRRAVEQGRITAWGAKKLVHPVLADSQWQENSRARAGSTPATAGAAAAGGSSGAPPAAPASEEKDDGYSAFRARREAADAELKEMELAQRRGELVSVSEIRAKLGERLGQVREQLLQLPARLAPLMVGETDQARLQTLLDDELRAALARLTEGAA